MADLTKDTEKKMVHAIEHLKTELKALRTGRANPAIVETISVEVYGSYMRLKELASISVPEPRQLLISPYDPKNIHAIAKAIESGNLNLRPVVDGNVVRIKIPEMDQKTRKDIVQFAKQKNEETKVKVRNIRRDSNESARKQKTSGELSEDLAKKMEKTIQELTDKYCTLADTLTAEKEKEIMTI
jgi:ribosome recycling factor